MNAAYRFALAGTVVSLLVLGGCGDEPDTGPGKVRWDREVCERCAMTISDPGFAAQIRGGPENEQGKLYKFDDLGCAIIWLDQQTWKDNPSIEIWVSHFRSGEWIDARRAWYTSGQHTPMNYGLGAQIEPVAGALDFEQARDHIYRIEQELNLHGGTTHLTLPANPAPGLTQ